MNNRTIYIIKKLISNSSKSYTPLSFFSNELGVSVRTIQNDMKYVKEAVESYNLQLITKRALGFQLQGSEDNKNKLLMFLKTSSIDGLSNDFVELRRQKITHLLLNQNEKTSINALAEQFYVSRTSIVKDIKQIEEWLENYQIQIDKTHNGTSIQGDEKNIRRALSDLVKKALVNEESDFAQIRNERLNLSTMYRLEALFDREDILKIEIILCDIEKVMNQSFNDFSYINLVTHLLIMVTRQTRGNLDDQDRISEHGERSQYYMQIAEKILQKLNRMFHLELGNRELDYIYQHLMCTGIQSGVGQEELEEYINSLDTEGDMFVRSLIQKVSDNLHLDLTTDKELYLNLRAHSIPMLKRIKYGRMQSNILLEEIKEKYSALFGVVLISIQDLNIELANAITDSEIGYITIHFQSAIERNVKSKKAIIVCPEGIGFSRLIYNRIKYYVPLLEIVDIVPLKDVENYDLLRIDLILSTVPLDNLDIPVIVASSFADLLDIKRINNHLIKYSLKESSLEAREFFQSEFIYIHQEFKDKYELIAYCCKQLLDAGYVKKGYEQTVLNREQMMSTEIGRGVSIPHGYKEFVSESVVVLVTLKEPILWNKKEVDCIFLLCLKFEDALSNKKAINSLFQIIDMPNMIAQIREANDKEDFFRIIDRMCG